MSRVLDQLAMAEEIARLRAELEVVKAENALVKDCSWHQSAVFHATRANELEAKLDAARAKALEDALEKVREITHHADTCGSSPEGLSYCEEIADAISAMNEPTK